MYGENNGFKSFPLPLRTERDWLKSFTVLNVDGVFMCSY